MNSRRFLTLRFCLPPIKYHHRMEDPSLDGAFDPELTHWLTCESRCFGDKGDVEDITEG